MKQIYGLAPGFPSGARVQSSFHSLAEVFPVATLHAVAKGRSKLVWECLKQPKRVLAISVKESIHQLGEESSSCSIALEVELSLPACYMCCLCAHSPMVKALIIRAVTRAKAVTIQKVNSLFSLISAEISFTSFLIVVD